MIPTIILICCSFYSVVNALENDGDQKTEEVSFWKQLLSTAITWSLLWWAGIFENFSR